MGALLSLLVKGNGSEGQVMNGTAVIGSNAGSLVLSILCLTEYMEKKAAHDRGLLLPLAPVPVSIV